MSIQVDGKGSKPTNLHMANPLQHLATLLGCSVAELGPTTRTKLGPADGGEENAESSRADTGGSSELEPATQMDVDVDSDDGDAGPAERCGSPMPAFDIGGCAFCEGMESDDEPELDLPGGGFCCAGCAANPSRAADVEAAAREQLKARDAAKEAPRPVPPQVEPRRSGRVPAPLRLPVYEASAHWSSYDLERTGERHAKVHDESRKEVEADREVLRVQLEAARQKNGELASTLDRVFERLRTVAAPEEQGELTPEQCQSAAAVLLQEAIASRHHKAPGMRSHHITRDHMGTHMRSHETTQECMVGDTCETTRDHTTHFPSRHVPRCLSCFDTLTVLQVVSVLCAVFIEFG